jgi:DNA polymerase-3 subunit beta
MKISIQREALLTPLLYVVGAIERRQTKPILAHLLLRGEQTGISLSATDLEIEIITYLDEIPEEIGTVTLPARKLLEICRNLPEGATIELSKIDNQILIKSAKSRFMLSTFPVDDFPLLEEIQNNSNYCLPEKDLKLLLDQTAFAMAQQDVRYYLNGLLFEFSEHYIRTVATDGHRMGIFDVPSINQGEKLRQVIMPRKGVLELQRLLQDKEAKTDIKVTTNHLQVHLPKLKFTSKLIDGKFPDYMRVIPKETNKKLLIDKEQLKQALTRASILSNEKFRGVRLILGGSVLKIQAHNIEREEAEEELEVSYEGDQIEIGFNVKYLLDVLTVINHSTVEFRLQDHDSSALVKSSTSDNGRYVVMPMKL